VAGATLRGELFGGYSLDVAIQKFGDTSHEFIPTSLERRLAWLHCIYCLVLVLRYTYLYIRVYGMGTRLLTAEDS